MLKIILHCFSLIVISNLLTAQSLEFSYDNNGNQISRMYVVSSSAVSNKINEEPQIKSMAEEFESSIQIYPNPTEGVLYVQILSNVLPSVVQIRLYGSNAVLTELTGNFQPPIRINIQNQIAGIYYLEIIYKDSSRNVFNIMKK